MTLDQRYEDFKVRLDAAIDATGRRDQIKRGARLFLAVDRAATAAEEYTRALREAQRAFVQLGIAMGAALEAYADKVKEQRP